LLKTLEELQIRATKAGVKIYHDVRQRCGRTLVIDLMLLDPVVALTLKFIDQ
jgi:hypothetical protein